MASNNQHDDQLQYHASLEAKAEEARLRAQALLERRQGRKIERHGERKKDSVNSPPPCVPPEWTCLECSYQNGHQ